MYINNDNLIMVVDKGKAWEFIFGFIKINDWRFEKEFILSMDKSKIEFTPDIKWETLVEKSGIIYYFNPKVCFKIFEDDIHTRLDINGTLRYFTKFQHYEKPVKEKAVVSKGKKVSPKKQKKKVISKGK